jgi:LAO/AO transport system kinase
MKDGKAENRKKILNKIRKTGANAPNAKQLADGVLEGDRVSLSRAITLVESNKPEDEVLGAELLRYLLPKSGRSVRLAISGVPGAGKSTFIEAFGMFLIEQGFRVAVLAIDPSSEKASGSILGDKTRMNLLSTQENAYIRPTPNSGLGGGVARRTRECIFLCEAAGFDYVLIETVGVGQSETAARSMVDVFMLLGIAGAGDELQGIKRGIMEMADIVMINKADGDNLSRAKSARQEIQRSLHLFPQTESGWLPRAGICSAIEKTGLTELNQWIDEYLELVKSSGYFLENRSKQAVWWFRESIRERLLNDFRDLVPAEFMQQLSLDVEQGVVSVSEATKAAMDLYRQRISQG